MFSIFIFLVKLKVNLPIINIAYFLTKCVKNNLSKRDVSIQGKQLTFHILPFLSVYYLKSMLIYVYFKEQDWI